MDVDEEDDLNSREDEGFVLIANELLDKCNIKGNVSNLSECSDAFFLAVYQGLLGDDIKEITKNPITHEDRVKNCQSIIDTLASEILDVDLCHIKGKNVVSGDRSSIRNLLEIFAGLLEYFLECAEGSVDERDTKDEEDDSNILTSEHDIISGVLREELGPSYTYPYHTQTNRDPRYSQSWGNAASTGDKRTGVQPQPQPQRGSRPLGGVEAPRGERREVPLTHPAYGSRIPDRVDTTGKESITLRDNGLDRSARSGQSGFSTGHEADTSKVSDSTAELIRLGETSTGSSSSSKAMQGREESDTLVAGSSGSRLCPSSDISVSRPPLVSRRQADTSREDSQGHVTSSALEMDLSRAQTSAGRRSTDVNSLADLTQYTLESSTKQEPHVSSSFLSGSSASASWSESLISPLDPVRDGSIGTNGFESLGVRPKTQPQSSSAADTVREDSAESSHDQSTVHHYHHHYHHGLQAVPGPASSDISSRSFREQGAVSAVSTTQAVLQPSTSTGPSATSLSDSRLSSHIPSSSYRHSLEPSSSVDQRTFDVRQLRTSALGPSYELKQRPKDLRMRSGERSYTAPEPPPIRREVAPEVLARYRTENPVRGRVESSSEGEVEGEDLAQLSDSVVDYSAERDAVHEDRGTKLRTYRSSRLPADRDKQGLKTSSRRPRRGVTFKDDVETIPITSRMDRLRRLLNEEERDQRKQQTDAMRSVYRDQLRDLQREEKKARQPKRKKTTSPSVRREKKKLKATAPQFKQRGRLEAIYRPSSRRPRKQTTSAKGARKRSASASPVMRRHRPTSPDRHTDVFDAKDALLLPAMFEEFPFLHVSPQTAHNMWTKQARQLSALMKSDSQTKRTKTQQLLKEAERRQEALAGILNKELEHSQRMREQRERLDQERSIKNKLREKRHVTARARRYYHDYQLRMHSKMLKRRTREEQIFKKLFEDGLEIQKERIRELRQYAKEKREAHAQRQQNEIQSMENYYRDQFSMLAEGIARERCEMEVRENAQDKVMRQMRRELRHKMEHEIQEFQENLTRDEDSAYFRQLEADRLRREFQLAAYKTHF